MSFFIRINALEIWLFYQFKENINKYLKFEWIYRVVVHNEIIVSCQRNNCIFVDFDFFVGMESGGGGGG